MTTTDNQLDKKLKYLNKKDFCVEMYGTFYTYSLDSKKITTWAQHSSSWDDAGEFEPNNPRMSDVVHRMNEKLYEKCIEAAKDYLAMELLAREDIHPS